jgi:hypothetical protein
MSVQTDLTVLCHEFGFVVNLTSSDVQPRMDSRGFKGAMMAPEPVRASVLQLTTREGKIASLSQKQEKALFAAGAERISFGHNYVEVVIPNGMLLDI